ncbi:uncharacterized protein LOC116601989 isoform X1 [Nematostella vectensis]|uniref:uncharacterized protein LOC116601989 isoform X1 n=1 Tax=Nematostella vectensis TaxID=45351 RepID=UPI00207748BE|nr:uncharacterized protein LOC116601989 isoform X1 [Nematostella vectensis]XP_048581471.1 uncharacterized protein LOC116601989 isoform X1 [Nematostella vectensis]
MKSVVHDTVFKFKPSFLPKPQLVQTTQLGKSTVCKAQTRYGLLRYSVKRQLSVVPRISSATRNTTVKACCPSTNSSYIRITFGKRLFTNVVAKWPGNAHDSFIFQDSGIHDKLQLEHKSIEDGVLIGESGYGCKPFLITPFPHPETPKQEAYNEALGKTRVKIEQTLGVFKRRFHLMHTEIRMDPSKATLLIGACAVLHNISIIKNDVYNPRGVVFEDDQPEVPPMRDQRMV